MGLCAEPPMVTDKHAMDKVQKSQVILQLYLPHYHYFIYFSFQERKKKTQRQIRDVSPISFVT